MPPLLIRPYDDARDRAPMIALYRAAWHAAYAAVDGAAAIDQLIADLLEGDPPQMFALGRHDVALIAEQNGQVLGGIRGHPRDGLLHLSGMYVRTDAKRRGIGRALLSDLLLRYPPGTVVRADVRPTSTAAVAFYEAQGFIRIGRTRTNAGGSHWVDTIEMQRTVK
jgi:ribosomal protein S18 acetylase RimI-like enzyme